MKSSDNQSGITLIELLVAMTIMVVITGMIILTWSSLQKSFSFTSRSDEQRELTRDAVSRIAREIRDLQGPAGLEPVVAAEPNKFSFYSSFNLQNQLPASQPKATIYTYVPGTKDPEDGIIYRQRDNGPSVPIMRNVVNGARTPIFSYVIYRGGEQFPVDPLTVLEPQDMQSIVSVEIHVISDLNPEKGPRPFDLRTSAQLRNLRLH
jgi:Tfp pilus assembly protein PilW